MSENKVPVNKILTVLDEIVAKTFQFKRLDELADKNPFVQLVYSQLIAHLNYVILRTPGDPEAFDSKHTYDSNITIADLTFDGSTWEGKMNASAEAFRHMANKLDDVLSIDNISSILTAIQAGEIAKTAIGAASTIQRTTITEKK